MKNMLKEWHSANDNFLKVSGKHTHEINFCLDEE